MTCEYCRDADGEIVQLEADIYDARNEVHRLTKENELLRSQVTAARLAVVPAPEGDVVEAVENVMKRYDADMKLGDNADACRDDLVALIAAEREACAAWHDAEAKIADGHAAATDGMVSAPNRWRLIAAEHRRSAAAIRAGGRP